LGDEEDIRTVIKIAFEHIGGWVVGRRVSGVFTLEKCSDGLKTVAALEAVEKYFDPWTSPDPVRETWAARHG